MNPYDWSSYYLLVSFYVGRDPYSFLLDHASQEQFIERAIAMTRNPNHVSVMRLTEETFELLETSYRNNNQLIEGE